MLRAIIIDDEKDAIETLSFLVKEYFANIEIIGTANGVKDGIKSILTLKPDFIFLDIDLHFGTGFDLLESIPQKDFHVIFTTAFNDYAIQAFKVNAIDYILKPIDIDDLRTAIKKAEQVCNSRTISKSDYNFIMKALQNTSKKISIQTNDEILYIKTDDIIRIEADGSYSTIYLIENQKYYISKCLRELQDQIESENFIRTHHSQIINLKHVEKYSFKDSGVIRMIDGCEALISRRKREEFKDAILKYVEI